MKAVKCLLVLISLAMVGLVTAQQTFQRSIGGVGNDYGRAVVVCSDGGYMIAGATNSFLNPSSDVYVLRIDEAGDYVWGRNFGSENHIEWAVDLVEEANGDFLLAGYTDNSGGNGYDGLLMKIDGEGNHLWTMNFGGSDWDFFQSIELDEDGNIYLGGITYTDIGRNAWLLKLSDAGEPVWEETLPALANGGISDINRCGDGNFVFTGSTESPLTGEKRIVGGRFDRDGELFWASEFEDFGNAEGNACACTDDQLKLIGNSYETFGPSVSDIIILGFDMFDGAFEWIELISSKEDDRGMGIGLRQSGNLNVCGARSELGFGLLDAYSTVFGPEGNFLGPGFGFSFGGSEDDLLYDLKTTPDGGYITVGETNSFGNNYQVYIIKVDAVNTIPPENINMLDLATPIDNIEEKPRFCLYPNPTSNYIHIAAIQQKPGHITLRNATGQTVFSSDFIGSEKIKLPSLTAGIYFAECTFGKTSHKEKLVIVPR